MTRKPKVRPCKMVPCAYSALKGRQFCGWHYLARQSNSDQAAAAKRRLARALGQQEPRARVPKNEWPPGERWCAGCQTFVPLFYATGSRCRACTSSTAHAKRIEDTYGLSEEAYQELLARQGGRCAICRNVPRTIRLAVDHDHKTGAVRGLLCKRCNHDLLGAGHDDITVLWQAIAYLLDPPASRASSPAPAGELMQALVERLERAYRATPAPPVGSTEPPPF